MHTVCLFIEHVLDCDRPTLIDVIDFGIARCTDDTHTDLIIKLLIVDDDDDESAQQNNQIK